MVLESEINMVFYSGFFFSAVEIELQNKHLVACTFVWICRKKFNSKKPQLITFKDLNEEQKNTIYQ